MTALPLSRPLVIREDTPLTANEATRRLREAVAEGRSVEVDPAAWSRRHLAGEVDADRVRLQVDDANWMTRKKSWNVELSASLKQFGDRVALSGVIDIPDRRALDRLVLLFQLIGVVFGLIALGVAARRITLGVEPSIPGLLIGLVVAAGLVLGPVYIAHDGKRAAGDDAALLKRALRDILNPRG